MVAQHTWVSQCSGQRTTDYLRFMESRNWPFVIDEVLARPGMWTGRPTFSRAVSFVMGFDLARGDDVGSLLQQRLTDRHGPSPIHWSGLLAAEATGRDIDSPPEIGALTAEEDAASIELMRAELLAVTGDLGDVID